MRGSQIPTIAEDESFPRPSMGDGRHTPDQCATTDSSDLDPPPVAHFELSSQESKPKEVSPPPIVARLAAADHRGG
ncbi:uncharacterized protein MYCGRDRAFT_106655 [Zymoseptoria tritici IPO323]|uniref:Uncharacterized protein n=1 Tax=Zymoseptoria tritici (strain CBS 115943 / IPO323) TaxID=336722 RepID=F9XRN8_ZYMTI|nr:uncharacterized protein MYCGRDRAFT_106655 [Zymoseptoria tritici IPO323]EGP82066.1 hypothetical protein MYCGRDRAFT_106655 [Zymoseptoria tritici IPO323]